MTILSVKYAIFFVSFLIPSILYGMAQLKCDMENTEKFLLRAVCKGACDDAIPQQIMVYMGMPRTEEHDLLSQFGGDYFASRELTVKTILDLYKINVCTHDALINRDLSSMHCVIRVKAGSREQ